MTGWRPLPDGTGTVLTAAGEITLAAQLGALTVWADDERIVTVRAAIPNPARPRLAGRQVLWGPHRIDIDSGTHLELLSTGDALPGYDQTAHVWATGGDAALVAAHRHELTGHPRAVVALLDSAGAPRATIWEASDVAPVALWLDDGTGVLGTREAVVVDGAGRPVRTLPGATPPFRIEGDRLASRVLVAEHGRLGVWELATGESLGQCAGTFVDCTLTPDGTRVVSVDFAGRLRVHRVARDLPVVGELTADDAATAVAVTDDRVVASFAMTPAIRTTALRAG